MKRWKITIILFTITALAAGSSVAARQNFESLSAEILESLQSFYPVRSTEMGVHAYDHRFADYSSKTVKNIIKQLERYETKLYRFRDAKLSDADRLNYHLIKSELDIAIVNLKRIKWHVKSPMLYAHEALNGLYSLVLSQHLSENEKLYAVVARMKAVPNLFAVARKNLKKPPPILVKAALESLETTMSFYHEIAGVFSQRFPDRADEIQKVSTRAREAMNDFATYLIEIKKGPETSFAIGKNNFDYMLSNGYYLPFDSDSMLTIGLTLLKQAQKDYREYQNYVDSAHQNGNDSVFVPADFAASDILDYYNWETNQVRVFLEQNDIISIPDNIAPVTVIETPPFLRSVIGGIAYQPAGPFDTIQHGLFYARPIPKDLDRVQLEGRFRYIHRRGFRGSVVHEAFPGHHLQMQITGQHADPWRKWVQNIMMIEGWALYCEEMMYRQGLYGEENPAQWLGVLRGIRFRAARIVADIKLHTGQFTYQECVDWMCRELEANTESNRRYIEIQVRWYVHSPTTPMSYLVGKREIMAMRRAAEARDGDNFSLKTFHDDLLKEGCIPPPLMWEIMGLTR